jgi:RHH-type transcriptional regulator, rel operon repressor / antitoxin RelB
MANTSTSTLSIRLNTVTKKRLAKLARSTGRSSNFLIADAVEAYVADQERLMAEMAQADKQIEAGHYVKHQDMKAWLLSWGTTNEIAPPRCACGKDHDALTLCR